MRLNKKAVRQLNYAKTKDEVNEFFISNHKKIVDRLKISSHEVQIFDDYRSLVNRLLDRCGERFRKIKENKK